VHGLIVCAIYTLLSLTFLIALSHWCIFHSSEAKLVVETWNKQFQNSEKVHRVPLLYLANDIVQNSKSKGEDFMTEFLSVLPAALKDVFENGDDEEKLASSRLVSSFPGSKAITSEYNYSNHSLEMW